MTTSKIQGCKQASCNVAGDGKCIEQRSLEECPYVLRATSVKAGTDDEGIEQFTSPSIAESDTVSLYLGDELTARATHIIMRAFPTHVIALAGGQECGKTSLLTCLYDCFQRGIVGGYLFAGSKTLPGFEQRCFGLRTASGKSEPTTERTPSVDEFRFLHLAVRREDLSSCVQHLLFSDITGEAFNAARQSADGAERLSLFRRADHFVLIIDGENIASPELRHKETSQIKTLFRGLLEGNILTIHSFVNVVVSKWDSILGSAEATSLLKFLDDLQNDVQARYGDKIGYLSFHQIAAMPKNDSVSRGFGLEALLTAWAETSALSARREILVSEQIEIVPSKRAFIRYHYPS